MATVGADLKNEKVMNEINQVTLEVGKIESKLQEMGMGSRGSNDSSKKSKSEPEGMPKGETKSEDAEKKQEVSYASTLMKSVKKEDGSRDPSFQKAIEESAIARMVQREKEKAQQQEEIGEAIYQSIVELSKEEIEGPPSYEEEEAVREVKAVSLKLLQSEERKKELEKKEKQVEEEEAILRSVQDASKKTAAEELLKVHIDAAVKASTEEIKLQIRREVVREVVVPMKLKEISKECAEAQALSKALNEEMAKVEEKRRKAKANAASLTERMALRASPIYQSKSQPLMGGPESGQPLVLLMLGERSYEKYEKGGADQGNLQFASALLDCGCSSITLIDEDTLKKWRQHFGKMVRKVRWLKSPLVVNTAGDDKPLIVAMAEVYVVLCHETGTSEAGWVECDVMRGGNTGGCTLIIGNKFMRKQTVGMHFSEESGEGGHIQSDAYRGDVTANQWQGAVEVPTSDGGPREWATLSASHARRAKL